MYTNSNSQHDQDHDLLSHSTVRWGFLILGMVMAGLFAEITIRRPMMRELTAMRWELSGMELRMQKLVGAKEKAYEANDLLTALTAQQKQLDSARSALASIRDFRRQIEAEARLTGDAVATLDQIVVSQQRLRDAKQDVVEADVAIQKLTDLQTKILENSTGVETAQQHAAELITLKQTIQSSGDVSGSQQTAEQLVALRKTLEDGADQTEIAREQAGKLLTLRDDLTKMSGDIEVAEQNWAAMRKLEADMLAAGKGISDAIETLELLTDLSDEMRMQSQVIAGVRRSLMDFAALETTVGRVMRVLEPLAQLKNLSRMSDAEVRTAARAILDQRTKLSQRETISSETPASPTRIHSSDDLELEPSPERLVPPPIGPTDDSEPTAPTKTKQLD